MGKTKDFAGTVFLKLKELLIRAVNIRVVRHSLKLSGVTALEVCFQALMHEALLIFGVAPSTYHLFEATTTCLYLLSCLCLVVGWGIQLYFEIKKEVFESQIKLTEAGISEIKNSEILNYSE